MTEQKRPFPTKPSKFGPLRPVSDPILELTRQYVEQMGCRSAGSLEARLMRDWLRMYRQIEAITRKPPVSGISNDPKKAIENDG